ncbi:arrestin-C [Monodelphis domestica]|uniref:arrestin-C n=1 Tax=Monodelphis domestica TaxID=13616 RepID=UPI0024E25089|nr:arrestin-C [Monodelphis domestica]
MATSSKVFKKTCPNRKLSIYLGKRDFVDHVDSVEPIDGVVLVDPEYMKDQKVFVVLTCAFRYGRDDLDVIGLTFRKDLYVQALQVLPRESPEAPLALTALQECLLRKLGANAHPFTFQLAPNLPCSVTLQPGPEDAEKACGVDFEVKSFYAENLEEKIHKRNSVRLIIRKVQFAPSDLGPKPRAETAWHFLLSDHPLKLEAWMDKEVYYHGEPISIHVAINNGSSKLIKKIKVAVDQIVDVVLYSGDKYTKTVFTAEFVETVAANSTFSKSFTATPSLAANRQKQGLALDGQLKHEDTNLASSTILQPGTDRESLGILVSYQVRISMVVSRGGILGDLMSSDMSVALPLRLMHPKPSCDVTSEDVVIEDFAGHDTEEETTVATASGAKDN